MNNIEQIGKMVRMARGGSSLREFAQKCDLSHTHLDSIEKGHDPRTGKPVSITLETIRKISRGTGYGIDELLGTGNGPEYDSNPDIRLIARAGNRLSPEQAEQLRIYAQYMYPEAFDK